MIIPVILAGGSGTRLWPLSRQRFPKQMLALVDEKTLLEETALRLNDVAQMTAPLVICNQDHRFMVADQLQAVGVKPVDIILEPIGRNTAPAVAVAALAALEINPEAVICILPADHYIPGRERFHSALETAAAICRQDYLATFGILPDSPETGYGYIRRGPALNDLTPQPSETTGPVYVIDRFVEKPDLATAKAYLASGDYFWNSGMFMFKAKRVLDEMQKLVPDMISACRSAYTKGRRDLDFLRLDPDSFASCPGDSIDYAVMEHTAAGAVIPLDAGWSDLGSWDALWQAGDKDAADNVSTGDVILHDVQSSFCYTSDRLLAAVGLSAHIVVATTDAVFVCPRDRVQDVKQIVATLKTDGRREAVDHRRVYRPWGWSETLAGSEQFEVRRITIRPKAKISLQKHAHRAEHWIVVAGHARVVKGNDSFTLTQDQSTYIPEGVVHRLENAGQHPLEIIEVRTGAKVEESDIVRLEDEYGR